MNSPGRKTTTTTTTTTMKFWNSIPCNLRITMLNPCAAEFSPKMPFFTVKSFFFGCNDSKLVLILTKRWFPTLKVDFPEIRRKNVHFFNLVHAHKPKFGHFFFFCGPFPIFFFFLLLCFPFSLPFYSPYLLLFISFFSAVKSLGLIADKVWKWGHNQF